jgi:hypothetical protein
VRVNPGLRRALKISGGVLLAVIVSLQSVPISKGTAAAVALRDLVPGYQQLGTEYFTEPRLEKAYARHWYLTATPDDSKHDAFVAALTEATANFPEVDVFLLAHGNSYVRWVEELPPAARAKIRLVYDTGGGSTHHGPHWLRLGVQAFVGHPGGNVAPLFYVKFLPRYLSGEKLEAAVAGANAETHEAMVSVTGRAVAKVTGWVSGRPVDTAALWAGTEAQIFKK